MQCSWTVGLVSTCHLVLFLFLFLFLLYTVFLSIVNNLLNTDVHGIMPRVCTLVPPGLIGMPLCVLVSSRVIYLLFWLLVLI